MRTVLHVGPHVPVEWIAAHGLTPRRLVLHVDRNGACQAGICPHAQAVLHEARSLGGMLLVLAETCDQMRRAAAMLSLETERDGFFLFHVPSTQGPAAVQLYRDECLRLTRFLLRSGGTLPRQDMPFQPATELRRSAGTRGVPIAVIGGPLLAEHETLFAVIEQLGGAVVVDGMEGGERSGPGICLIQLFPRGSMASRTCFAARTFLCATGCSSASTSAAYGALSAFRIRGATSGGPNSAIWPRRQRFLRSFSNWGPKRR